MYAKFSLNKTVGFAPALFLSTTQASKKWGISPRRIQVLCAEGRIPGVFRVGNTWAIPEEAQKPKDARIRSGRYIKGASIS